MIVVSLCPNGGEGSAGRRQADAAPRPVYHSEH
jgi:hypothetical protein